MARRGESHDLQALTLQAWQWHAASRLPSYSHRSAPFMLSWKHICFGAGVSSSFSSEAQKGTDGDGLTRSPLWLPCGELAK